MDIRFARNLRITAFVSLGACLCAGSTSLAAEPTIDAADLQSDVSVLESEYRALHPGLLRYLTADDLTRAFGNLRREFAHPRTLAQAYLSIARFAASIKCGHTYANFFNQDRDVQQRLFESTPRLPFYFRWIGGKMIVTQDFTESQALPPGTEVIRINENTSDVILQTLLPLARADGSNDAKRIDQLSVTGDSKYEPFDIYFPLVFPQQGMIWNLNIRLPTHRESRRLAVKALTFAERIAPIEARENDKHGGQNALFDWQDLENGIAYLRMSAWDLYQSKWDWTEWLNAHLDRLSDGSAKALIIDLRNNEGGEDIGDEILKRLIVEDLPLAGMKRLVRYRSVPTDLLHYLKTWDPSFKNWGEDAKPLSQPWPTAPPVQYFGLAGENAEADARAVLHPVTPHFAGTVFVISDASNSSATFQFEQVIQQNHLGWVVGQPTGGNRRGINGGAFFFLTLPHSHIELDLPLIGFFPGVAEPDAGLIPDVIVPRTAADVSLGIDREMVVVRRLIESAPLAQRSK